MTYSEAIPVDVLLIEDDEGVRLGSVQALELSGLTVRAFPAAELAMPLFSPELPSVIVSDVRLPGCSGLDVLGHVLACDPAIPVILITGHGDIEMAVSALRTGAYDFIEKPFTSARLVETCRRGLDKRRLVLENRQLRSAVLERPHEPLIGASMPMRRVRAEIQALASGRQPVMIAGESGTGKELAARALHQAGGARGVMLAIPCGLPGEEDRLHAALATMAGGEGGTLLLDRAEDLTAAGQAVLLARWDRLIAEAAIRLVATTGAVGSAQHAAHVLRPDLLFRLRAAEIAMPALRERREDIPELALAFHQAAAMRLGLPPHPPGAAEFAHWAGQEWPGNVREFAHAVERHLIGLEAGPMPGPAHGAGGKQGLSAQMDQVERSIIEAELRACHGNIAETAERLGIPRKTLYDKIYRFNIATGKASMRAPST